MAEQLMEGVKPTRMALLEIRKKLELADKGHKLLEEKRDALVEKFFKIIDKRKEVHKKVNEDINIAFSALIQAQMIMGEDRVEELSYLTDDIGEINLEKDNIMGVKIPKVDTENLKKNLSFKYGFMDTIAKFDDAQKKFKDLILILVELADLESSVQSLSGEIEKTKRRVNVLENNLIPKLKSTRKYIEMQLEEREREDFFRRKRIKAILEE
jgi:V/A-type H+-transporting ATPase subunit D